MATSILSQLKGLGKQWKTTKAREPGNFQELPDGDYHCVCKQARLENAKSSARLQVAWAFNVLKGENKNRKIFIYQGLEGEDSLGWLKGAMLALGVKTPKNIENLPKFLEQCIDSEAMITVRANGQFTNKYINAVGKTKQDADLADEEELEDL